MLVLIGLTPAAKSCSLFSAFEAQESLGLSLSELLIVWFAKTWFETAGKSRSDPDWFRCSLKSAPKDLCTEELFCETRGLVVGGTLPPLLTFCLCFSKFVSGLDMPAIFNSLSFRSTGDYIPLESLFSEVERYDPRLFSRMQT